MRVLTDSRELLAYRERNGRICWLLLLGARICFLADEKSAGESISRITRTAVGSRERIGAAYALGTVVIQA